MSKSGKSGGKGGKSGGYGGYDSKAGKSGGSGTASYNTLLNQGVTVAQLNKAGGIIRPGSLLLASTLFLLISLI